MIELAECPIPGARGYCNAEGRGTLGVLMLGEALGDNEYHDSLPFRPNAPAGSVLERAIRRCGYSREQFVLFNTIPTQPPKNYINPKWERAATEWGLSFVDKVVAEYQPRCILALGGVPLRATTGLAGRKLGVSDIRGYPLWSDRYSIPVIATFHPSFLRRGAMSLMSVLMHDIKLAVAVAHGGGVFNSPVLNRDVDFRPPAVYTWVSPPAYIPRPTENDAWAFYDDAAHAKLIAYDIETAYSPESTEDESDELEDTDIRSIQFSLHSGSGIFMPWRDPFIECARRILLLDNDKAGANSWRFDDPLLLAHGCDIRGTRHDIRWAWHHLQPDLKASLQFVMSFYNDGSFPPWKHLAHVDGPRYGIMDVDAVQRILS